jgi:hypothetical protein
MAPQAGPRAAFASQQNSRKSNIFIGRKSEDSDATRP